MKKLKNILNIIAVVIVIAEMTACSSTYPELVYEVEDEKTRNQEQYGKIVIAPTLDLKALFYNSAATTTSKGVGAFDKGSSAEDEALFNKKLEDANFYLMGYRKTVTTSGALGSAVDFSTVYNETSDHKDCLLGSTADRMGELAKADSRGVLSTYDDAALTNPRTYYWSEAYPQIGYDFFAYYLDDAVKGTVLSATDRTTIPLTVDGTQDVMAGYAVQLTQPYLIKYGLTDVSTSVINHILSYGDGGYSTYGAYYSVQPKIEMKHAFSRIIFYTAPAGNKTNMDLTITGVDLKMKTHGDLTVAASYNNLGSVGYVATGNEEEVPLKSCATYDASTGTIIPGEKVTSKSVRSGDQETVIGELLVPAGVSEYDMRISCTERLQFGVNPDGTIKYGTLASELMPDGTDNRIHSSLKLSNGNNFEAGKEYYVHLNVYGASEVKVYVETTEWEYGGNTDVNVGD